MSKAQKAIIIRSLGHAEFVTDRPIPKLRDDYILVRTVAVALNPIDWKQIDGHPAPNALVGHDYAGIVEQVGPAVKKPFRVGDRVCGLVAGSDVTQIENGAFAEYVVAKGDIQMKIPDGVSFEEAASVGAGIVTAGQGLYQGLGLRAPAIVTDTGSIVSIDRDGAAEKEAVLIYGGSTASGVLGIQFAKLSGYTVITTCSPSNFDFVKGLGADAIFDYNDPHCAQKIRTYTNDNLKLVWDTISLPSSAQLCADAISSSGGKYYTLLPVDMPRKDVVSGFTNAITAAGEYFEYGPDRIPTPASPEDFQFAAKWIHIAEGLWAEGKFSTHRIDVREGGLKGILNGLQDLRENRVSARKLVYRIADTP